MRNPIYEVRGKRRREVRVVARPEWMDRKWMDGDQRDGEANGGKESDVADLCLYLFIPLA